MCGICDTGEMGMKILSVSIRRKPLKEKLDLRPGERRGSRWMRDAQELLWRHAGRPISSNGRVWTDMMMKRLKV